MRKFFRSIAAAFTTPTAVKAEVSIAVIVLTRLALFVGPTGAAIIAIIVHTLGS